MAVKINRPIRDVEPPAPRVVKRKLDIEALLTPEKKKEIRDIAAAKVKAAQIADAEKEYLEQQITAEEQRLHPEIVEEMRELTLDLPPFMDRIIIDGKHYMNGTSKPYKIRKSVYDVMRDVTWNAYKHDDEINNRRNSNAYRRERQLRLNASEDGPSLIDRDGRPATKF